MGLQVGFSRAKAATSDNPDLAFGVGSHDPDGSDEQKNTSSIEWELATNKLELHFSDVASKKYWRSNGKVTAIPDLENSNITVEIASTVYSSLSDTATISGTKASRQGLGLSIIFLYVSGREIMIRASEMRATTGASGMPSYVGEISLVKKV